MKHKRFLTIGLAVMVVGVLQTTSNAQVQQPMTPAAAYFGRQSARNTMQSPGGRNSMPAPQPVQIAGTGKPFQHIQQPPTLSPYLALDLVPETATSVPNYHAFVMPRMQQQAEYASQSRELQRLRQQVRVATARGKVSKSPTGGVPTTGSSEQFMNLGSYFPGTR